METYKQKYEQALKRAKKLYGKYCIDNVLEGLFPELKESEDERIRKWIIDDIRYNMNNEPLNNSEYKKKAENAIAWLEKQKAIDVLDAEEREFADNVNSYRKDMDEFYKKGYDAGRKAEKQYWLGKQDEQKDYVVDMVEPKFHEGDWAVSNLDRKARQISEVHFDEYNSYYVVDGKSVNLEEYDRLHHLWSIEDAKDGDVLVHNDITFVFKGIKDGIVQAICPNLYDNDVILNFGEPEHDKDYYPATKEQRTLLFQKMHEAGYEFDFNKNRLKKIDKTTKSKLKFKVGDWVTLKSNIYNYSKLLHIIDMDDKNYEVETQQGDTGVPSIDYINRNYRLWSVKDAKDGDILTAAHDNGRNIIIFIFKKIVNDDIYCHCLYDLGLHDLRMPDKLCFEVCTDSGRYIGNISDAEEEFSPANKTQRDLLFAKMREEGFEWGEEKKELKKIEQNHNIHPKFKVGDWIASDRYNPAKIIGIDGDKYEIEFIDGSKDFPHIDYINKFFHLWTIEDARDGDVLAFDNDTIVIFKDLYNASSFHSYCHIEDGVFNISRDDTPDWWNANGFYPATKEQRDTFFAKMKEVGYKWDAEKKEPKKIETKGGEK